MPLRRAGAVLLAAISLTACARAVPPIGAGSGEFSPVAGERELWAKADAETAQLIQRVGTYEDPRLTEYLSRVAGRVLPDRARVPGAPQIAFTIVRDPALFAFSLPSGRVFVSTGLLSRLADEAQLAMVVAHELMHVTHRHALRYARKAPSREVADLFPGIATAVTATLATPGTSTPPPPNNPVGMAVLSPTANAVIGLNLPMVAVAAVDGYGRDMEREADNAALQRVINAGYDPNQVWKAFEGLLADGGERGPMEMFALGTARGLKDRMDNTRWLVVNRHAIAAQYPDAIRDTAEFQDRVLPVVLENAQLDTRAGRFALAQKQLNRVIAASPNNAAAHSAVGDLHRLQSQRQRTAAERALELTKARAAYARALALDPNFADTFRQLGLLHYQEREIPQAREAFQRYLTLQPNAPDARRIHEYLTELTR